MFQYLKSLIVKTKLFQSLVPFKLTRSTEKFDVVRRVPVYTKIKFLNS